MIPLQHLNVASADTQRFALQTSSTPQYKYAVKYNFYANSFTIAQQIYHAAMVCNFGFPRITREDNFQWETNSFRIVYRVTFDCKEDRPYTDVAKELALCMKELKN